MTEPTAEALLNQFCAILQDTIADRGRGNHEVSWEVDRTQNGIVNVHIGHVESYSIYVNTNEWMVLYR
ncbi:hypothetical protein D3C85_1098920 [compost metagenome]